MCGIVGYVGRRDACPILVKGLHRLEYRGYDSAGVALVDGTGALTFSNARARSRTWNISSKARSWAELSASPTRAGRRTVFRTTSTPIPTTPSRSNIALIHNGIIENYRVLKDALDRERLHVPQQHRFGGAGESDRIRPPDERLHAVRSRAAGAPSGGRSLCHRRGREGQPDQIIAARAEQPDGHRHRRGRVFPRVRRRVDHRIYAGFRLCERRGDRRHRTATTR